MTGSGHSQPDEAEKAHKTDLLTYQINEITEAALTSGEEEELLSQRRILRNSERITQALAAALALLSGDDNGETPGIVEQMEELLPSWRKPDGTWRTLRPQPLR